MRKFRCVSQMFLLLWLVLVVSGCGRQDFKEPIGRFQQNTDVATKAITSYYTELNDYERTLYFQELLFDPTRKVLKIEPALNENGSPVLDAQGRPKVTETPLLHETFDPKSVQARVALIRQIATYGEQLSEVAGNDAPERFKTNTQALAVSLNTLRGTFQTLGNKPTDKAAKDYLGPLGTIVGIVGKLAIEKKRQKALKVAVLDGFAPVEQILGFLARDLDTYVDATRRTGEREKLANAINTYNNTPNRSTLSQEQRQKLLDQIQKNAQALQTTLDTKPSDVVRGMQAAHRALVNAVTERTPVTIGTAMSTLEAYEDDVEDLVDAVAKLRALNKGEAK